LRFGVWGLGFRFRAEGLGLRCRVPTLGAVDALPRERAPHSAAVLMIFRKSTPPQSRQLNILISESEQ